MSTVETYKGYRGAALAALQTFQAPIWSDVKITTDRGQYSGIVLPRSETADALHVVLKLRSGYNIGIAAAGITNIELQGPRKRITKYRKKSFRSIPKNRG